MDWTEIFDAIASVAIAGFVAWTIKIYFRLEDRMDADRRNLEKKIDSGQLENRQAHTSIQGNIKDAKDEIKSDFNKRFDDLKDYIKLAMKVKDDGDRH